QAERLSMESGCWFVMTGQHANAGQGAFIYASPRIRDEAMKETHEMCTIFSRTTGALITARRTSAKEIAVKLTKAEEDRDAA
ncbi:hypothetical protein BDN72DRAFT_744032, partial [Pluteus cervinus]